MKNLIKSVSIIVLLFFVSCGSDGSSEVEIFDEVTDGSTTGGDDTTGTTTNLEGQFVSDAHPTSGTVKVNDDSTVLNFENFKTDDGPKLLVYLSTTVNSTDFVDLGDLKGISGNYSYAIPANTDLTKYKYVVIWCVDFLVSFGHAELK